MKKKSTVRSTVSKLPILAGVFVVVTGVFLALFAAANPPSSREFPNASSTSGPLPSARVTARAFMRVTPDGVVRDYRLFKSEEGFSTTRLAQSHLLAPRGNTLWSVDDQNAIADGVAIDANNVWGAWILSGARLSIYPIAGNGTEAWHFSSFDSGNSGVAAAT